ncbi:prion-inhibition and propagation-domain-containing protein [Triangularia setosa]|uniref:Prion-inhibition and propagation-domain-containing protein n=1 Tax=Triangularia setosa TaxID=2587417 RepID=A0AAN7A9E0_9PEZI|nr:prion-inhibition and propagation-domain-containing protein [Podospora setosa]
MAEVAGLVVGAVGLVTLFGTCVEGYNKIQLMRTSERDCDFLISKFDLVKIRFELWGQTVGLEASRYSRAEPPMISDKTLCTNWHDIKDTVGPSLISMGKIFNDRGRLEDKYGLKAVSGFQVASSVRVHRSSTFPFLKCSRSFCGKEQQRRWTVGEKVTWAIRGRQGFECLIDQLESLVRNLEKVADYLGALERQSGPKYFGALVSDDARQVNGPVGLEGKSEPVPAVHVKPVSINSAVQINGPMSMEALQVVLLGSGSAATFRVHDQREGIEMFCDPRQNSR